ncbi:MAG: hypothetical protein ACO1OF_16355 [Adhaeribacter sp.]
MAILNYTTKISASKTVGEIQELLTQAGARRVIVDNNLEREPVSISFQIEITEGVPVYFSLPCNWEGVLAALVKDKVDSRYRNPDQAKRVAWRVVKDWIEAQLAIIYAQQATLLQVFLPYAQTKDGNTLYDHVMNNQKLLLNQ